MTGSRGIGGTRYQITAVLLTYLAISMSAIPVGISYIVSHRHDKAAQVQSDQPQQAIDDSTGNDAQASNDAASGSSGAARDKSTGHAILRLLFFGIASPFLELASPGSGIIGLVILFVGLSIAFRMTKATPLDVDGPYELSKILS